MARPGPFATAILYLPFVRRILLCYPEPSYVDVTQRRCGSHNAHIQTMHFFAPSFPGLSLSSPCPLRRCRKIAAKKRERRKRRQALGVK